VNQIIKYPRWYLGRIHPPKSEKQLLDFLLQTAGTSDFITKDIKPSKSCYFLHLAVISGIGIKVASAYLPVKMRKLFRMRIFLKQQSNMKFEIV